MAAMKRRTGRALLALVGLVAALSSFTAFVPTPEAASQVQAPQSGGLNPALAASAAIPALTWMATEAEAMTYQDARRYNAILVPFTTIIVPGICMAAFTVFLYSPDAFWQLKSGSRKGMDKERQYDEHPAFMDPLTSRKDPLKGFVNRADWEKGLEEAWEKAKPEGCTLTAKDKLRELATQNNPHFWRNKYARESA